MRIECKPQCRLSDAIKVFKGNTARWLFLAHPEMKKQLWGGRLWNPSYFVATVSERTEEQVRNYTKSHKECNKESLHVCMKVAFLHCGRNL